MAANQFLTISMITKEALRVLRNSCLFTRTIDRQYSDEFARKGAKIGQTVNVRKPAQYTVSSGAALQPQGITENYVPLTLSFQKHVDVSLTSFDEALSLNSLQDQYLKPSMAQLATQIDIDAINAAINGNGSPGASNSVAGYGGTANYTGTLGSGNLTYLNVMNANAYLDSEAAPQTDRWLALNPFAAVELKDNLKGLPLPFVLNDQVFLRGRFFETVDGTRGYVDQNMTTSTGGTYGSSTPVVKSATTVGIGSGWASSSTVQISGMASGASTLNQGDLISFGSSAATYALPANPLNRLAYSTSPRTFTVVNTTSDSSGVITAQITPALIYAGQFQNCVTPSNAAIAAGTTVNIIATSAQSWVNNLIYHRDAYTIAYADLPMPRGVHMAARHEDAESGLSLRMVAQYTINDDSFPARIDTLYGCAPLRQELGCRILS